MNRRGCLGLLCSGCIVPKEIIDSGEHEHHPCIGDILIDAPLQDMAINDSIIWNNSEEFLQLLIIRLSEVSWTGVWRICTHGNCDVEWRSEEKDIVCVCHYSIFSQEGFVVQGPATRDLNTYPICFDDQTETFWLKK
jgi:Rieske Fe-S protein